MSKRLPDELITIRAGDIQDADLVELPDLVYMWLPTGTKGGIPADPKWTGRFRERESRLKYPTWHHVYDAFTDGDFDQHYAQDLGVHDALYDLHENYVALRIGVEHPMDAGHEDILVAMHEEELVRVRRTIAPRQEPKPDVVQQVCKEAGLGVMAAMLEVVADREEVPETALDALTVEDVLRLYEDYVGPAVDRLEAALLEGVRILTRLDVERPFIVSGPDGEETWRFTSHDAAADFLDKIGRTDASVAQGEWSITNMIDPEAPPYRVVD